MHGDLQRAGRVHPARRGKRFHRRRRRRIPVLLDERARQRHRQAGGRYRRVDHVGCSATLSGSRWTGPEARATSECSGFEPSAPRPILRHAGLISLAPDENPQVRGLVPFHARHVRDVGRILLDARRREPVIGVVSAFQGVTNQLLECARLAERADAGLPRAVRSDRAPPSVGGRAPGRPPPRAGVRARGRCAARRARAARFRASTCCVTARCARST